MNKLMVIIGIIFFTFLNSLSAQDLYENEQLAEDKTKADKLVELHITYNHAFPYVSGYRIQVFMESGNEALSDAEATKEKFEEDHSNIPVYITFSEPYYRVRVGDFRTRLEAIRFLEKIKRKYANAWVIKDNISFSDSPIHQKTN